MGRDSEAFASVSRGALKLKVDDSGKIKKSKHKKKKSKKSKNRDRSASPEMGKGLNKVDKEPNYRFAKDISKVRFSIIFNSEWSKNGHLGDLFQLSSLLFPNYFKVFIEYLFNIIFIQNIYKNFIINEWTSYSSSRSEI